MESAPYFYDLGLLIHLFFYSLEGEPMDWFHTLSKEDLSSFKKIRESFLTKYQHKIDQKSTSHDLSKEVIKQDKNWVTFANRWREMTAKYYWTNKEGTCKYILS